MFILYMRYLFLGNFVKIEVSKFKVLRSESWFSWIWSNTITLTAIRRFKTICSNIALKTIYFIYSELTCRRSVLFFFHTNNNILMLQLNSWMHFASVRICNKIGNETRKKDKNLFKSRLRDILALKVYNSTNEFMFEWVLARRMCVITW